MKRFFAVVVLLLAAVASGSALAHGGRARVHLGFHFGFPLAWHYPWYYYPPPVYYYPAPAPPPPVYVERGDVVPEGPGTWHYCAESKGYYPYVKQCPGGWQRVPATPPQ